MSLFAVLNTRTVNTNVYFNHFVHKTLMTRGITFVARISSVFSRGRAMLPFVSVPVSSISFSRPLSVSVSLAVVSISVPVAVSIPVSVAVVVAVPAPVVVMIRSPRLSVTRRHYFYFYISCRSHLEKKFYIKI